MSKTLIIVLSLLVVGTLLAVFFSRQARFGNGKSKTPITKEDAIVIARDVVVGHKGEFVLEEDRTLEKDFGWVFFRTTKKYLESHNLRDLVPGVGPFVVDLYGEVTYLSSAMPLDKAIEMYQSVKKENENRTPSQKIAVPVPIVFDSGDIHIYAPNNSDKPSLVMKGNGVDTVDWEIEVAKPVFDASLEKDVQLLDYFVSHLEIKNIDGKKVVYVEIGSSKKQSYILDIEDGHILK